MLVEMAGIDETGTFQRARTPAQKQQRREAILAAARALALGRGVGNVTLAAIAEEVGLAKSNVLSYFGTLDAIYLQLVNEEWRDWVTVAAARLTGATSGPAEVADALSLSFAEQPLLCDLLAHAVRYVEHSVSADDVLAQQLTVGPAVDRLVSEDGRCSAAAQRSSGYRSYASHRYRGWRALAPRKSLSRAQVPLQD